MTYGAYLHLGELLSAQVPVSDPPHHDELLFIVQHQTSELWLKLALHELGYARDRLGADDPRTASKALARVERVMQQLTEQWSVLATLTPSEYAGFRRQLGTSSGFQSWQYRAVELLLGAKDERWLRYFADDPVPHGELARLLNEPSLYDTFWSWLAARGHAVPAEVLERDVRRPWVEQSGLVEVLAAIYHDPEADWAAYEMCEELVDLEQAVGLWRYRHLSTVVRIIGSLRGTGGTSGVGYLRAVLDQHFFPELLAVRSEVAAR